MANSEGHGGSSDQSLRFMSKEDFLLMKSEMMEEINKQVSNCSSAEERQVGMVRLSELMLAILGRYLSCEADSNTIPGSSKCNCPEPHRRPD